MNKISVIIPTKDRPVQLERLLVSIDKANDHFDELIVVDQSEDHGVLERNRCNISAMVGRHVVFREKGVSKARNKGVEESKGNILIFADDDFVVTSGWISRLVPNLLEHQYVMCVTGRILSYRRDHLSKLYEETMSFDRGNKKRVFSRKDINLSKLLRLVVHIGNKRLFERTPVPWGVGYGFYSFRRRIFDEIGDFDIKLGRGAQYIGGEDPDILYRILKRGYRIIYEPHAVVYHNHRQTFEDLLKSAYMSGISIKALTTKYLNDAYMLLCFFGAFLLYVFSLVKASLRLNHEMRKLIAMELKGFLTVRKYR